MAARFRRRSGPCRTGPAAGARAKAKEPVSDAGQQRILKPPVPAGGFFLPPQVTYRFSASEPAAGEDESAVLEFDRVEEDRAGLAVDVGHGQLVAPTVD